MEGKSCRYRLEKRIPRLENVVIFQKDWETFLITIRIILGVIVLIDQVKCFSLSLFHLNEL